MTINFGGKEYPAKSIFVDVDGICGERLISVDSLEVALMTKDGAYVSEEARSIDEDIFFFVPDNVIDKDDEALRSFVEEMVA